MKNVLRVVLLTCLGLQALPATAESALMDGRRLTDFRLESNAFNQQDPMANAYRAGHYNGYLAGMLDALQEGRRVCFRECICELDKLVAHYLDEHPEATEIAVAQWLVPLLERRYPCPPAK